MGLRRRIPSIEEYTPGAVGGGARRPAETPLYALLESIYESDGGLGRPLRAPLRLTARPPRPGGRRRRPQRVFTIPASASAASWPFQQATAARSRHRPATACETRQPRPPSVEAGRSDCHVLAPGRPRRREGLGNPMSGNAPRTPGEPPGGGASPPCCLAMGDSAAVGRLRSV